MARPLHPIERMIDQAVGYKPAEVQVTRGLLLPVGSRQSVTCCSCAASRITSGAMSRRTAQADLRVLGWTLVDGLWKCEECSR